MVDAISKRTTSDRVRYLEIAAVLATAIGKVICMDILEWKLPFIVAVMLSWSAYVFIRAREPGTLAYWGFRIDNFGKAFRMLLPVAVTAILTFVLIGYLQKTINLSWHIFPVLVLYPLWGTIQQFLVISLVAGNLSDMNRSRLSTVWIILLTAILFGVVHYPNYWLMGGTFLLALIYGWAFLRVRNVFALGLLHGWLGGLFFYTVVDRDPFIEVFGILGGM
jgi:membrane protease YdiL (CAAX protease family)